MRFAIALLFATTLLACVNKGELIVDVSGNIPLKGNTAFKAYEDLSSPKFVALREKYRIDTALRGEADEFQRQLLLRNWIRSIIRISDFETVYPGEDYPELILDEALKGQGYHCGHYMTVQNAVMNAYGYVTRCLGAGPGVKGGPDGHHGVNEIWSNKFSKWYLSDAKYNHHFTKNGIPLSALEVREEFLRSRGADLVLVKGPRQTPLSTDGVMSSTGTMVQKTVADFAQTYTWLEWESYNDRYTNWPESSSNVSILNMYEDEYFKQNTWIWDGKPHWAYSESGHMVRIPDRDAIEWTPNTIAAHVSVSEGSAKIQLESFTPNLRSYQMRRPPEDQWTDVPATITLKPGEDEQVHFRTMNLAGVAGPEYKIIFKKDRH